MTARRATLEVSGGVGGNRFTDTLAIEQMGNEPMIVANPDTVRIDAAGGSVDFEVLSGKRINTCYQWRLIRL